MSNTPGQHKIKELLKTPILGKAHILWKVLTYKCKTSFNEQNNITYTINCNYRTAATLYTLETCFVSCI